MLAWKDRAIRNELGQLTGLTTVALYVCAVAHWLICGRPMLVTALVGGPHAPEGLHPLGRAFDVRTKDTEQWAKSRFVSCAGSLASLCGGLALLEGEGTANEHLHVQI